MAQINTDGNAEFPLKKETYEIIGICMAVNNVLGHGFLEIIYKDAIEIELRKNNIPFARKKKSESIITVLCYLINSMRIS